MRRTFFANTLCGIFDDDLYAWRDAEGFLPEDGFACAARSAQAALIADGVRSFVPVQDLRFNFNYHHTAADTLDKVDKLRLAENAAVIVMTAYALADASTPAPRAK